MKNINNVADIVTYQANIQPQKVAIIKENKKVTYKELDELIWKMAVYLKNQKIKKNDIVIQIFKDQLLLLITMLATARLGATVISLSDSEINQTLKSTIIQTSASCLVTDITNKFNLSLKHIHISEDCFMSNQTDYSVYISDPTSPWQILKGSGSTGDSKFFTITHKQEISRYLSWTPITADDVVTSFTSLTYAGVKRRLLEIFMKGATFCILDMTKGFINTFKNSNVTILQTTVFHTEQILEKLSKNDLKTFKSLKGVILAASSVSMHLRNKIKDKLTDKLYVRYASNETGTICYTSFDNVFSTPQTVGLPIDSVKVEIVDKEGLKKRINEIGLIRIKSTSVVNSYLNNKEATKKAFKNDWFYPGDIGKFTQDGQLIHLGRYDDMMIMNGINIYPSQIENVMLKHNDVNEAIAFPLKNNVHQDIPVCAIILKKDSQTSMKELERYGLENLGSFRAQLIFTLDKFPRNEQGKVQKKAVIELVHKFLQNPT